MPRQRIDGGGPPPKTKKQKPTPLDAPSLASPSPVDRLATAPQTKTVKVRAHTRTVNVKPVRGEGLSPVLTATPAAALGSRTTPEAPAAKRHRIYQSERAALAKGAKGVVGQRNRAHSIQSQRAARAIAAINRQDTVERTPHIVNGKVTFADPRRQAALQKELTYQQAANKGNNSADPLEVAHYVSGLDDRELEKYLRWQPSASTIEAAGIGGGLPGLVKGLGGGAQLIGDQVGHGVLGKNVAGNLLSDVIAYPEQAIPAAYALGGAALHPTTQGKAFVEGIGQQLAHPVKSFEQHPLFTAMLLHGGISAGGRTLGAVGRAVPLTRDAFSTARAPLSADGIEVQRHFSKDAVKQVGQRVYDRYATRPGDVITDAYGRVVRSRVPRANVTRREVNRTGDYGASRANSAERQTRLVSADEALQAIPTRGGGRVARAIDRTLPSQPAGVRVLPKALYRPERDVVSMVHEGLLSNAKNFQSDLIAERDRLTAVPRTAFKDPDELKARNERIRTIDRVLKDKNVRPEEVLAAARSTAGMLQKVEREAIKRGALNPIRAARSKLVPYAMAKMGAEFDPVTNTLRVGGEKITNTQIRADMRRNGVDPQNIAYLPHNLRLRGKAAFHTPFGVGRVNFEGQHTRTGTLFARGATPHDYAHIVDTIVGKNVRISNIREFDHLLSDVGVKRPNGEYFTAPEAENFIKNSGVDSHGNRIPGAHDLVPVRAFNSRGADIAAIERQQTIKSAPDESAVLEQHFANRLNLTSDRGARNVVLVPRQLVDRLHQHIQVGRGVPAKAQAATGIFRRAVLPFSTKWIAGNALEGILRDVLHGTIPIHDGTIGHRLIASIKEDADGQGAAAELHGGLMYARKGLTVRREGAFGSRATAVAHAPVVAQVRGSVNGAIDGIFALNGALEHGIEAHALGKLARNQIHELTGSWTKSIRGQRAALRDVAKGLTHTAAQVDFARNLDVMLGKYSRFSPQLRNTIQTYAPFLPWYLNAVRFVAHTLPLHHPIAAAVLTQAERTFQSDWEAQHKDVPPGDLKTAIKAGGGFVDAGRYTPFGFLGPIAGGDLSGIGSPVLPQAQGIMNALQGNDPFGQPLKTADRRTGKQRSLTPGETGLAALNQILEETVPASSLARRLQEHGETADSLSSVFAPKTKPGSAHGRSALQRALDPFSPVYVKKQAEAHPAWGSSATAHAGWGVQSTAAHPAWGVKP